MGWRDSRAAELQIMAKGMRISFRVLWKTSVGFLDLTTFVHAPGPLHGLAALPGTCSSTCLSSTTPTDFKNHLGPWVRNTDSVALGLLNLCILLGEMWVHLHFNRSPRRFV